MGKQVVQCERGGYFTTTWIPGVSFSDLRVGVNKRITYCPIHHQSETIQRIKARDITPQIRKAAQRYET
jgi:hypothetical protein